MIINLNTISDSNAHAALVQRGHKEYCFIGCHRQDRNLLGSPLTKGPSNLLQYRAWLWSEIHRHASVARENPAIYSALRKVAKSGTVVHENTPEIAALIVRAARWYKEKVLMPQIVCTVCLVYLTDHNKGDFHMCAECAWSGRSDYDDDWIEDISWFCGDCSCILTHVRHKCMANVSRVGTRNNGLLRQTSMNPRSNGFKINQGAIPTGVLALGPWAKNTTKKLKKKRLASQC